MDILDTSHEVRIGSIKPLLLSQCQGLYLSTVYSTIGFTAALNSFIVRLLSTFEQHTLSRALQACQASDFLILKSLLELMIDEPKFHGFNVLTT